MKNIRLLMLVIVTAIAVPLNSKPPILSQHDMCCWLASWVQFVYNLKPVATRLLTIDEKMLLDFDTFKNSDWGKKLAGEKTQIVQRNPTTNENEFVEVSALKEAEKFFDKKIVGITKAYQQLFKAIHSKENTIDTDLTRLQKLIQGEAFGTASCVKAGSIEDLITHPLFSDTVTHYLVPGSREMGIIEAIKLINLVPWDKAQKPVIIFSHTDTKIEFTLELTQLVTPPNKCPSYDLIGIILHLSNHYIAFIKDQYDPMQPWWRCDTLAGNRTVTKDEIIKECLAPGNETTYTVYHAQSGTLQPPSEPDPKGKQISADYAKSDLMQLTFALKKLAE